MPEYSISYELLASTFHLPVFEASHRLGVPPNVLYQLARETGHECWPAEKPARPTGRRYGQEHGQQTSWMHPGYGQTATMPHPYMGGHLQGNGLGAAREAGIRQPERRESDSLQRYLPMPVHDGTPQPFYPPGRVSHFQPYQGQRPPTWTNQLGSLQGPHQNQNHPSLNLSGTSHNQRLMNSALAQPPAFRRPENRPPPEQGQGRAHMPTGQIEKNSGAQTGRQEGKEAQIRMLNHASKINSNLNVSVGKKSLKQPSKNQSQASVYKNNNDDKHAKKKTAANKQSTDTPFAQVVSFGNDKGGTVQNVPKGKTEAYGHPRDNPASLQLLEENLLAGWKKAKGVSPKPGSTAHQGAQHVGPEKDAGTKKKKKKKKPQKSGAGGTFRTEPLWLKPLPASAQARVAEPLGDTVGDRKQLSILQDIFGEHMPTSWHSHVASAD